jgi:hypothetical protein
MPINAQNPIELPPVPAQIFGKWWVRDLRFFSDLPKSETLIQCELILYRDNPDAPNGAEVCRVDGQPVNARFEITLTLLKAIEPSASELIDQILVAVASVARTMGAIDAAPPEPSPIQFPEP